MPLDPKQNEQVALLARRLIESLRAVEARVVKDLQSASGHYSDTGILAVIPNPMLGASQAQYRLDRIRQQAREDLNRLRSEPFVVCVLVENESGSKERFYFSRGGPLAGPILGLDGRLASYHAPYGRLAEYKAGDSVDLPLPGGKQVAFTILQRVKLVPVNTDDGWDGRDDRVEIAELVVTLNSLREFLAQLDASQKVPGDFLGVLLAEMEAAKAVQEGIRRRVVDRMALRDQPTLDQYQGEIFRLSLDRRLMLSGPPGTGKTTTLIRRLAQKRSSEDIGEDERMLVPEDRLIEFFYPDNWIMFTPTELLKLYLKEAFAQEGIAATEERVRTWDTERRRLGRDVFRLLRSEQGGRFILDESAQTVLDLSSRGLLGLADAFGGFIERKLIEQYQATFEALSGQQDTALAELIGRVRHKAGEDRVVFSRLFELVDFREEFQEHIQRLVERVEQAHRVAINVVLERDRDFLERLADFLSTLGDEGEEDEEDEAEESESEEELIIARRDRRITALQTFRRALSAYAISLHEGRTLGRTSRRWKVLEWLGDRLPTKAELTSLGAILVKLRHLRFLAGTHRNLVDRIPAVYRPFRREALLEGKWYHGEVRTAFGRGRVVGAEVDVILLMMLRNSRQLLSRERGRWLQQDSRIATLESVKQQYVTQVLVDEATDFSPVQLACMLELAHPTFRSLFACGDVRQRVTQWGVRDLVELDWISRGFEIRELEIGYRQSRKLVELACSVAQLGGGPPRLRLPDHLEGAEIDPVLGEYLQDETLAKWLAERIREIERGLGKVPSIAIFVDGDQQVDELVLKLRPILAEYNLDAVGCPGGRVVGGESQIRIFDVQHIKGLEFEAVFFIGVDGLMVSYGDLFANFLFVGVTRAATYLGITCQGKLPPFLEPLLSHFTMASWSDT